MEAKTIDELFERYRRAGDSEALSTVYDLAYDELFGMARKLARDTDTAEELVGRTFLTAIERAERWDSSKRLVPWLVGILIVESKRMRRKDARAVDPERVTSPVETHSEEAASRSEVAATLHGALAKLPEAQRELLRRHYFEDETPTSIAQSLGREAGTVRVQLHRARMLLRQALPAGFALGAALAVLAPHGLAGTKAALRERVLAEAEARATELAAQAGAGAIGSFAVWKIAAAVLAVLALSGGAWWALERQDEHTPATDLLARPTATDAEHADSALNALQPEAASQSTRVAGSTSKSTAPATAAPGNGVRLVAEISGLDARPGETMDVQVRAADLRVPPHRTTLAAAPKFELDLSDWYVASGPRPREFFVVVDHPRFVLAQKDVWLEPERIESAVQASSGSERVEIRATLALAPATAFVTGRVIAPKNDALGGAEARAYAGLFELGPDGNPGTEPVEGRPCGADGSFSLRARAGGAHVLALSHTLARPRTERLELAAGDKKDLGELVLEEGASISGTLRTPSGQPAVDASLHANPLDGARTVSMHGQPLTWRAGRFEHPGRVATADDHGLFFIGGLAPGAYELRVDPARDENGVKAVLPLDDAGFLNDKPSTIQKRIVTAPAIGLELSTNSRSVVLHVTAQAQPVPRCSVQRLFTDGGSQGSTTDDDGHIVLQWTNPAALDLRIEKPSFEPRTLHMDLATLEPGRVIEVELERGAAPCDLSFQAEGTDGQDLSWAAIWMVPVEEIPAEKWESLRKRELPPMTPGTIHATLDAAGHVAHPVRAGRYWVYVHENVASVSTADRYAMPTGFELEVPAGTALRQRLELREGGRVRFPAPRYEGNAKALACEWKDANQAPVTVSFSATLLRSDARQGRMTSPRLLAGATSETQVLEPGTYTLRVNAKDAQPFETQVTVERGKTTEVQVVMNPN